jgi:hypothetical protein
MGKKGFKSVERAISDILSCEMVSTSTNKVWQLGLYC